MISLEASATAYSMLRLRPACIACQDQWQLWPRRSAHSVRHKPSPQCCREAGGAGAAGGAAGALGALGAEGVFEAVLEIAGEGEGSGFAACVVAFGGVGGPGKLGIAGGWGDGEGAAAGATKFAVSTDLRDPPHCNACRVLPNESSHYGP